jgi:protoporphyrinogen oxidase
MTVKSKSYECCILGAGPAGFGAAIELVKHGVTDIIMIDRNSIVGGLARSENYDGTRFDVGPHRFYTKNKEIHRLWHETLGDDFKTVSRVTHIYYNNKFFHYPIKIYDVLTNLGLGESLHVIGSFGWSQLSKRDRS